MDPRDRRQTSVRTSLPPRGWLPVAAVAAVALIACQRVEVTPPNIVLVTLDTTRADRLGCYGYDQDTSPELDRLADDSIVYTRAYSTSSWTLPAHASLFTGKFPSSHGARYQADGPLRLTNAVDGIEEWDRLTVRTVAPDETTLAGVLHASGYRTGAVVAGPWLKSVFGLTRGFESYDDSDVTSVAGRQAPGVTDAAIRFVSEADDRPFFLFLNYFDAHGPYSAPAAYVTLFHNEVGAVSHSRLYDAEIRYADHELGRLLAELRERGLYDDALIVVTSDHGELLGEHGVLGHGDHLFQEEIRVPLIVKPPARDAATPGPSDDPVQLVDLMPMILARAALAAPPGIQGELPSERRHPIVAEVYPLPSERWSGDWHAIIADHWKLLRSSTGAQSLFDLETDPDEQDNRMAEFPELGRELAGVVQRYLDDLPAPKQTGSSPAVDADTQRALRDLGYLE